MDTDWTYNVLDSLLAEVLEAEAQLIAHLIVDIARNQDAAWFGECFQPCCYIDAIAVDIILITDDVADVDPDTEFDATIESYLGIAFGHAALDVYRVAHSVDDTDEFHQHAVARGLNDTATVLGYFWIDQLLAMRL